MAEQIKYVSAENLGYYDGKIKAYIANADDAVKSNLEGQIEIVAGAVDTEVTRAKAAEATNAASAQAAQSAADKAQGEVDSLKAKVGEVPADQTVMGIITNIQENAYDDTEIKGLISDNADAIAAIEEDYLKAADKTELQGNIDTVSEGLAAVKEDVDAFFKDADMTENAKDTLKELQAYIASDETAASEMLASIQQNGKDIDAVEGRMDTAEGKITTAEGKISANEEAIAALQGADTAQIGRIEALEDAVGESGSVAQDIADAKQAAIDAAATDAAAKASAAETAAKGYADGLDEAMNARVQALEAVDHEHTNKALLDTYTQTEANLADAVAKKHEHANKAVLDGITAAQITAWDAAEAAAKAYADAEVAKDRARLDAVEEWQENMVEITKEEVDLLFA